MARRTQRALGRCASPTELAESQFAAEVEALLAAMVARRRGERALENGLLELDARQVAAWLADYYRQHDNYDARWRELDEPLRPAHFEVAFGPGAHDKAEVAQGAGISSDKPFELACGDEAIRFSGRIDRIDVGRVGGQAVFSIVDYKSGKVGGKSAATAVAEGMLLQLPLYALAAGELLGAEGAVPLGAAYWHVAAEGYKEVIRFHEESSGWLKPEAAWRKLEADLRVRIRSLVEGIRRGEFPMASADDKCTGHCPFSTACRVNQTRSLDKRWEPPQVKTP